MEYLKYCRARESLKDTNIILNKSNNQKLLEILGSTLLLILAYDALLFGSDYLLQYYKNGEVTNAILINKPFFTIAIPSFIGSINAIIKNKINRKKEFNARVNLRLVENQIISNTDIYSIEEEALRNAKALDVELRNKDNTTKNITIYATDPYNTIYVDGKEIKSDDINKITKFENSNRFAYFQEEQKNIYDINYYEITSLDNELKQLILEQTNSQSLNQVFAKKKVLIKNIKRN